MLTGFDYGALGVELIILYLALITLKRLLRQKEKTPICYANRVLIVADLANLISRGLHDGLDKFFEDEVFGSFGASIFLFGITWRYAIALYMFFLISVLHLMAIHRPTAYRNIDFPRAMLAICLTLAAALAHASNNFFGCACLSYNIATQSYTILPVNFQMQIVVDVWDKIVKAAMITLLIITDFLIVHKWYSIKIARNAARRAAKISTEASLPGQASPNVLVLTQPRKATTALALDKRLALGFVFITVALIYNAFVFRLNAL
ncbi:unnamed protein product, partial [Mesorhabditis spiculigera]